MWTDHKRIWNEQNRQSAKKPSRPPQRVCLVFSHFADFAHFISAYGQFTSWLGLISLCGPSNPPQSSQSLPPLEGGGYKYDRKNYDQALKYQPRSESKIRIHLHHYILKSTIYQRELHRKSSHLITIDVPRNCFHIEAGILRLDHNFYNHIIFFCKYSFKI